MLLRGGMLVLGRRGGGGTCSAPFALLLCERNPRCCIAAKKPCQRDKKDGLPLFKIPQIPIHREELHSCSCQLPLTPLSLLLPFRPVSRYGSYLRTYSTCHLRFSRAVIFKAFGQLAEQGVLRSAESGM